MDEIDKFFEGLGLEIAGHEQRKRRKLHPEHEYHEATVYIKDKPIITRWIGISCPKVTEIYKVLMANNGYEIYHGNVSPRQLGMININEYYRTHYSMAKNVGISIEPTNHWEVPALDVMKFEIEDLDMLSQIFPDIDRYKRLSPNGKKVALIKRAVDEIDELVNHRLIAPQQYL